MNRWELTDEVKKKYKPVVEEWLNRMESLTVNQIEKMDNEEFCLKLSDTELRPYTLLKLLEEFGYGDEEFDDNGWELDFWIRIKREDKAFESTCEKLCIHGCGMTFELNLTIDEFM